MSRARSREPLLGVEQTKPYKYFSNRTRKTISERSRQLHPLFSLPPRSGDFLRLKNKGKRLAQSDGSGRPVDETFDIAMRIMKDNNLKPRCLWIPVGATNLDRR
mmetsp:Transcript_16223/g.67152  ORF Transcript_16223/g.67152 Transcript_16223/m.67152 type:complete len:104 (-) Transcript_16223:2810-3121(-)